MSHTEPDQLPTPVATTYPTLRLVYSVSRGALLPPVEGEVTSWILQKGPTHVGRSAADGEGIVLADDRRASERHAIIHVSSDRRSVKVRDAGSRNGTFVNGERVEERALADGDLLRIGNSLLLLRFASHEDAFELTDVHAEAEQALQAALTGEAPALQRQRAELAVAARSAVPILLLGESGTGKDVAASAVHSASGLKGRFVAVNCAAIPEHLAESLLFGHVGGAYTGASKNSRTGFFGEAHGGTLFLDEIGDLPLEIQPKLLRALETRTLIRVGATEPEPCDARVIAATNRDLTKDISNGRFRGDLFARLAALVVTLPPLRTRREDILPLFVRAVFGATPPTPATVSARLAEALLLYEWPYNVRELLKLAELAKIRSSGKEPIDLPLLADRLQAQSQEEEEEASSVVGPSKASEARVPLTRDVLERLMAEHRGVISRVAEAAGRSRKHIRRLLVDFKLRPPTE